MRHHRVVTGITEFLYPTPARRSFGGIVRWWGSRRLHYNLVVGGSGLVRLAMVRVISWLSPDPHGGLPPLMVVLVFGTLANVCYLLGQWWRSRSTKSGADPSSRSVPRCFG
jgi:hypothetical protein